MLWTGRILPGFCPVYPRRICCAQIAPPADCGRNHGATGWPAGYAFLIGVLELAFLVLYLVPRTSVLGGVLMMGLLGGAMATRSGRKPALQPHPLQRLSRAFHVGRAVASQRAIPAMFPIAPAERSEPA